MMVAIKARRNVRPGPAASAPASGKGGGAESTPVALAAQAAGTDSGPSAGAPPIPADGAPTRG